MFETLQIKFIKDDIINIHRIQGIVLQLNNKQKQLDTSIPTKIKNNHNFSHFVGIFHNVALSY